MGRVGQRGCGGSRDPTAALAGWLLVSVLGILVIALDDPTLETLMGAVWLWTLVGVGAA